MNLTGQPIRQKTGKPVKDARYLDKVRALPCAACGKHGQSEAHHCRDKPDHDHRSMYDSIPGVSMKSGDRDAIALCRPCHYNFHNDRFAFHDAHGKDYLMIAGTRATIGD
jgi:hypothetical protein